MATFVPGQTITTPDSSIEVTVSPTAPLAPGRHRFQLIVVNGSGVPLADDQLIRP